MLTTRYKIGTIIIVILQMRNQRRWVGNHQRWNYRQQRPDLNPNSGLQVHALSYFNLFATQVFLSLDKNLKSGDRLHNINFESRVAT